MARNLGMDKAIDSLFERIVHIPGQADPGASRRFESLAINHVANSIRIAVI